MGSLALPVVSSFTCTRFRGAAQRCAAGNDVERYRDDDQRLPCVSVRGVRGAVPCDELDLPAGAAPPPPGPLSSLLAAAERGLCTVCGARVERTQDVGDVVLALPCRHRIRSPRGRR